MNSVNPLDRSPLHLLHRTAQAVEFAFCMGTKGKLTPRQLALLMAIEECEGLNQTELTERTGIDRSTISEMIRRLQRKGLLQRRRPRGDERSYAVNLTEEGRRVLSAISPLAAGVEQAALNALPRVQRKEFVAALASIVDALERA
jgi:MarR family transcriptional regulator, temperature-dependent positive regulator of motility